MIGTSEWSRIRSRFLFDIRDVRGVDAPLASATTRGVEIRDTMETSVWNPGSDTLTYKLVEPDDFVIGLRSFQHGISHSTVTGLVSPAYTVLRGRKQVVADFFKYYFRSASLISDLSVLTQGIRQGQAIDIEGFRDMEISVPPVADQWRIAQFLEREVGRVDALLSLREKQISILADRYRSVVSQYYGNLFDRFGRTKLAHFLRGVDQGWSPQCEDRLAGPDEWAVMKAGCVNGGVFDATQHKTLPADVPPQMGYRIQPGNLLVCRASGSLNHIGSAAVVPDSVAGNLLFCDKLYRLRTEASKALPEFVALTLSTNEVRQLVRLNVSGAEGMANNVSVPTVVNMPVPKVPPELQGQIVRELEEERVRHVAAGAQLESQVALLTERRQSLIAAAISGEINVATARGVEV